MKKKPAHPEMPTTNRTFILNHFQEQAQDQALFSARKEYCMTDIWGEHPVLTIVTAKEDNSTPPETEVVEESKRSWVERLIRRF